MIGSQTERSPGADVLEEHAAVAAVEHVVAAVVGGGRAERRGGDEDRVPPEGAEHGRRPVERAVAGREGGVGEGAAPGLADGGGADEARGVVRPDAEEDVRDDILRQRRRRRRHSLICRSHL